jgi:hypothetical protein
MGRLLLTDYHSLPVPDAVVPGVRELLILRTIDKEIRSIRNS